MLVAGAVFFTGKSASDFQKNLDALVGSKFVEYAFDDVLQKKVVASIDLHLNQQIASDATAKKIEASVAQHVEAVASKEVGAKLNIAIDQKLKELKDLDLKTNFLPRGSIIPWLSKEPIPQGWALCDGTNGTPDFRNRFLQGAGDASQAGATEGTVTHTHGIHLTEIGDGRTPVSSTVIQSRVSRVDDDRFKAYRMDVSAASEQPPSIKVQFIMKL